MYFSVDWLIDCVKKIVNLLFFSYILDIKIKN